MPSTEDRRTAADLAADEAWPGVRDGETMRSIDLPGLTLAVRRRAATSDLLPPALFVHGLGGSSRNWSAVMERLAGDVECEALDLPGFGASPPPGHGTYSIAAHARAIVRCVEASHRGPVHLLGNSLGGAAATRVAAFRPDLVRTLTLISPALPELPPQRTALPTAMLAAPGMARLLRRMTRDYPPEQRARGVLRLCYGDPARITPEEFSGAVEEQERRQHLPYFWESLTRSARGLLNAYTLSGQHSPWRQAERVLAPTLLIYGGRDRLVSHRMADRAHTAFRHSQLLTLPSAGHIAMMEFPDVVAGAFREFLARDHVPSVDVTPPTATAEPAAGTDRGPAAGADVTSQEP